MLQVRLSEERAIGVVPWGWLGQPSCRGLRLISHVVTQRSDVLTFPKHGHHLCTQSTAQRVTRDQPSAGPETG